MAKLQNPKIEVKIIGLQEYTIRDLFVDFDISKDVYEEPNEAELTIYNLSEDKRGRLAAIEYVEMPLEIYLTKAGQTELTSAFAGEISDVKNDNLRPGHATRISCTGQKSSHYSAYVEELTFAAGTAANVVIKKLADAVELPNQFGQLPTSPLLLSQSFTGSAFENLVKFGTDYGLRVYVLDGVLNISSIHSPRNVVPKTILRADLLSKPIKTVITDEEFIERQSIMEATEKKLDWDPLDLFGTKKRRKKRKKSKKKKKTDYIEYDTIDKQLEGWDFECLCQPDINPDDIIQVIHPETTGKQFRVREINHYGSNETFDDYTSRIRTSVYEVL